MKRLLCILFCWLFIGAAFAGQIVNAEYIHNFIQQRWGVTVPYNPSLTNPQVVANMKYLLTAVDVTNAILNEQQITNWGTSEYATTQIADTVATAEAINNLVKPLGVEYPFGIGTTKTQTFSFNISAKGDFVVDWGDGNVQVISKPDTTNTPYNHTYDTAGTYLIKIKGAATGYSRDSTTAAISFNQNTNISSIFGSIGQVFTTLANGENPKFYYTFADLTNATGRIPAELFSGITGAPSKNMFYGTFYNSSGFSGTIPASLFSGLNGAPTEGIFYRTFEKCSSLSGAIPSDLFAGIYGPPARDMFHATFSGCSNLTGIQGALFSGINGAPAQRMYNATFYGCSGLTGTIPNGLFGKFNGAPQELMFGNTFFSCTQLTGGIPSDLFAGISGAPAKRMFEGTFNVCTRLDGTLPAELFADISGAPAEKMFYNTFAGCSNMTGTIPSGLFAKIYGNVAPQIFYRTFYNCQKLTAIENGVFGNLNGSAQNQMFTETFYRNYALRGDSAKIGDKYLYEIWPDATKNQVGSMYMDATGLSDYADIPTIWK